jgi:hypothetical protein
MTESCYAECLYAECRGAVPEAGTVVNGCNQIPLPKQIQKKVESGVKLIMQNLNVLRGATTFSIMTLSITTSEMTILSNNAFSMSILSIMTFTWTTLRTITLSITTISVTA